jgi:hypothetical protein
VFPNGQDKIGYEECDGARNQSIDDSVFENDIHIPGIQKIERKENIDGHK